MLNTIGSLSGAESTGIWPCVTYTAGVSGENPQLGVCMSLAEITPLGSCWALGVMYSGVAGSVQPRPTAQHLKDRIQVSYLDMETLDALVRPPTNKVRRRSSLLCAMPCACS